MRPTLVAALGLGLSVCWASTASAQVHFELLGGVTEAANRNALLGAAMGLKAGPVELDLEAGRMREVLPKGIIDRLNDLQREHDLPVQAAASLPANYALALFRVIGPRGPVQLFVTGGAGLARLQPRVNISVEGLPLGDLFGLTSLPPRTASMVAAGAGLRFDFDRVFVEGAYRYNGIYADFRQDFDFVRDKVLINVNTVHAGLGVRF